MSRNSLANPDLSHAEINQFPQPYDKPNVSVIIVPIVLLILAFGLLGWFLINGCRCLESIEANIALAQVQARQANSLSQRYVPVEMSLSDRHTKIMDTLIVQKVEIDQHLEVGESRASISEVNSVQTYRIVQGIDSCKSHLTLWDRQKPRNRRSAPSECTICLVSYQPGDSVAWSRHSICHHVYHLDCLKEWLTNRDECPMCRVNFFGPLKKIPEEIMAEDNIIDSI